MRLVGRLIYSTITRPKLSYVVHNLAQFMQTPRQDHWEAALRGVSYMKGNPGQGIFLGLKNDLHLFAYCDSDWASCPLTRRSLTGYIVLLGNLAISWKAKKQHTVSRSSAQAEYCSLAVTTSEFKQLKGLLASLGSYTKDLCRYFVIVKQLFIQLLIQCFMIGRSIQKLNIILSEMSFNSATLLYHMSEQLISLQTYLQKTSASDNSM